MSQKVRINGVKENRDSQAVFRCVKCGHKANADANAAMNILSRALDETGGDTASDVEDPRWRSREASTPSTQAGSSFGVRAVKGIPRLQPWGGCQRKETTLLDINPADRARLLASATAYAAGRRTYVVGAVSDVVAANAGRLDAAVRETLADAMRPAVDEGDPIDAPAWTRALAALETAAPDGSDGLDGNAVDLRILLHCAFRHDMGGDAGLWTRLLDDPPEEIDGQWRAIAARDLYEAGYAPEGAPEPSIQHLEPLGDAGDPAWGEVYLKLVGGER